YIAFQRLVDAGSLLTLPLTTSVAATSAGIVDGIPLLDLNYEEDSKAEVDFNVVLTGTGELVEVQGTGEGTSFSRDTMGQLLDLAESGIRQLFKVQTGAIPG